MKSQKKWTLVTRLVTGHNFEEDRDAHHLSELDSVMASPGALASPNLANARNAMVSIRRGPRLDSDFQYLSLIDGLYIRILHSGLENSRGLIHLKSSEFTVWINLTFLENVLLLLGRFLTFAKWRVIGRLRR